MEKYSMQKIVEQDLESLKKDRDELLEHLKEIYPYNKNNEDQFIMTTITTYNAVIQELEHIIKKAELYGAE